MEPRAHHVLIGIFTVAAVVAAVLFALWMRGPRNGEEVRYYRVIFNEAVKGLSRGSTVEYSGIKVGDVVRLTLDPKDPRRVLARIRVGGDVPIKQDTQARLALNGITGISVIELSGGSPESPRLVAPPGEDAVIVASPSPIGRLLATGGDLMTGLTDLMASVQAFVSPQNAQRLAATLENLEKASGALASQGDNVKELVRELTLATRQANAALKQASDLVGHADRVVEGEAPRALEGVIRAMASVERAGDNFDRLVTENRGALGSGVQGLAELGPAIRELRRTLASLRTITRRLEDNPAGFLLGRDDIKEFQP